MQPRDLKPCPICGAREATGLETAANDGNFLSVAYEPSDDCLVIFCGQCGLSMSSAELTVSQGLYDRWNNRKPQEQE